MTVLLVYTFARVFSIILEYLQYKGNQEIENSWIFRLGLNILGYATIFIPGIIIYQYVKRSKLVESTGKLTRLFMVK